MPSLNCVVFPVAGRGTRLLPLTKSVPKELLPVYDKPVLQFAVEEALAAGAKRLIFVTHASKPAILNYLKPDKALMDLVQVDGKTLLMRVLDDILPGDDIELIFIEQDEPLGLGHAVLMAADHVCETFGVILPDDVILGAPCLSELADDYAGGHMIAAIEVPAKDVSKYGIFRPATNETVGNLVRADTLVEKPAVADAPSRLAAVGRYILDPCIFDTLRNLSPGAGGEYQLTDAIAADAGRIGLSGRRFSGTRFDCGSHNGLLAAANARAAQVARSLAAE